MKKLLLLCLMSCPAFAADIVKHPRELKYPVLNYQPPKASDYRHKLAAGSTAYMVEDRLLPLVNMRVIVRSGAWLEPADKVGLASLTGTLIRSGGTKSKPPAVFDEEAAYLAAQLSSGAGDTESELSMNCLTKNLDACLDLFFDMARNPGFADDRLNLARTQTLQGMQRRNDSTQSIEFREFSRMMRGPEFFSVRPTTKGTLEAITKQDMIDFHSKYYYPANFIFAISGDFDTKQLIAKLDKAMAGWSNRTEAIPAIPKPTFQPKPGVFLIDKKGVNQGRARLGHIGIMANNPDQLAVQIMNAILGGNGFTSRIVNRVRSDEGLAYSAGSAFPPGAFYDGTFQCFFQSKSESVAQAIAIIVEEVNKIRTEKVTNEELNSETSAAIEGLTRRFATASAKAAQFATDDYEKRPEDYWMKFRDRLRSITADDVLRVAKKYLQPDNIAILVVGDADAILKGNPDKPQFQMTKFGTVERLPLPDPMTMVYPKL